MLRVTCRTPLLVVVMGLALTGCKRSALVRASDNPDAAPDRGHDAPRAPDAPQAIDGADAPNDAPDAGIDGQSPATCTRNEDCASGPCERGTCCTRACDGVCTVDSDCGAAHLCTAGRCIPCSATCTTSAVCVGGTVCVMRNFCSYCGLADAGATDAS